MTAKILDGKAVAAKERQRSAARAADFVSRYGRPPGLAVVKRIIEDHAAYGASIHVESPHAGGAGAAFRVRLSRAGA